MKVRDLVIGNNSLASAYAGKLGQILQLKGKKYLILFYDIGKLIVTREDISSARITELNSVIDKCRRQGHVIYWEPIVNGKRRGVCKDCEAWVEIGTTACGPALIDECV